MTGRTSVRIRGDRTGCRASCVGDLNNRAGRDRSVIPTRCGRGDAWIRSRLLRILAAIVVATPGLAACRPAPQGEERRTLRYLSWTSAGAFSADLVTRVAAAVPGATVETEHTSGSLVVLSSLQKGEADFGFSLADVAYGAYRRGIEPNQYPHTNLRAIAVRWVNGVYTIVPHGSAVRTLADLNGKRVGIVPRGSAGELLTRIMLDAYGLHYSDFKPRFIEVEQLMDALEQGDLDAAMPNATPISNLHATLIEHGLRVVPLDRVIVKRLQGQYPFVKAVPLEADLAAASDPLTVGVDSVLMCRADLDEPTAYQLTKAFYELLSDLARRQPNIDPANASATPVPLHPGAARFYREQEILNES